MIRVRQRFPNPTLENISEEINSQLMKLDLAKKVKKGKKRTNGRRGLQQSGDCKLLHHCKSGNFFPETKGVGSIYGPRHGKPWGRNRCRPEKGFGAPGN
jgi:hypothetical protein